MMYSHPKCLEICYYLIVTPYDIFNVIKLKVFLKTFFKTIWNQHEHKEHISNNF